MPLNTYLKHIIFQPGEQTFCNIDPATGFGFQGTADGKGSERVHGIPHVLVPVYDWQATSVDEERAIAKVLMTAAEASPLKLPNVSECGQLWMRHKLSGVLINPGHIGKIRFPQGLDLVKSDEVPMNRIVLLHRKEDVGYYIKQGHRRNVLAHNKRGLTSVQFYTAP